MNRKPIFDAVRAMLGRGFRPSEVRALDLACELAEGRRDPPEGVGQPGPRLGALSEKYESGGRGPGTVSGGVNDPGGVSYGVYQLASRTGTCAAFVMAEGRRWAHRFGDHESGSAAFGVAWKRIAREEPDEFRAAQHAFIERTHYRPVVEAVLARSGLDLDSRSRAVRDVTWSCAVQHGGAARILSDAIARADCEADRTGDSYDRQLVEAIYDRRASYVLGVANNPKLSAGTRRQLVAITEIRYPAERDRARAMLAAGPRYEVKSMDALARRRWSGAPSAVGRGGLRSHRSPVAFDTQAMR